MAFSFYWMSKIEFIIPISEIQSPFSPGEEPCFRNDALTIVTAATLAAVSTLSGVVSIIFRLVVMGIHI